MRLNCRTSLLVSGSLWSFTHLISYLSFDYFALPLLKQLLVLLYLINLFYLNSQFRIASVFYSFLVGFYYFPETSNHSLLMMICDFYILLIYKFEKNDYSPFYRVLGLAYLFAGVSKINYDFFNPMYSCLSFVSINSISFSVQAYSVIGFEILMGVMFILFQGQFLIWLSFLFHSLIAFYGFHDFFGVVIFILFYSSYENKIQIKLKYFVPYIFFCVASSYFYKSHGLVFKIIHTLFLILPFAYLAYKTSLEKRLIFLNRQFKAPEFLVLLLMLWQGLGPYLGLGQYPTFTMFSNLVIIKDYSNSLIVKKPLFSDENQWIIIKKNELPVLQKDWKLRRLLYSQSKTGADVLISSENILTLGLDQEWINLKDKNIKISESNFLKKKFLPKNSYIKHYCQW